MSQTNTVFNEYKCNIDPSNMVDDTVILFDVDGTLAESGKKMSKEMSHLLYQASEGAGFKLGIVGGGSLRKIMWQLTDSQNPNELLFDHYFSDCGCVYSIRTVQDKLVDVYSKNIRNHPVYKQVNELVKVAMQFISSQNYMIAGNLIDLRDGLVYISLVGMTATEKERQDFIQQDIVFGYRKQLISLLKFNAKKMGVHEELSINEGGQVGIGIYPFEWDKVQVLEHMVPIYNEIHYFGDKYNEGGNDHRIMNDSDVIAHKVDSPGDTYEGLSRLIREKMNW
tara:strand:+ start:4502 stop:5344 length:843 start_codon:yes stop_codon:yes gene_type:complete